MLWTIPSATWSTPESPTDHAANVIRALPAYAFGYRGRDAKPHSIQTQSQAEAAPKRGATDAAGPMAIPVLLEPDGKKGELGHKYARRSMQIPSG